VGYICIAGSNLSQSYLKSLPLAIQGVYVWTHISTGNQYVGSSKNIRLRIASYFKSSYHNGQLNRKGLGTLAVSRAFLKYPSFISFPPPSSLRAGGVTVGVGGGVKTRDLPHK